MKRFPRISQVVVLWAVALSPAHPGTPRILIVGDSWAQCMAVVGRDGVKGFGSLEKALDDAGMSEADTVGEKTAWGGSRADQWAKPGRLALLSDELDQYPAIDIVFLVIGGNDYLKTVLESNIAEMDPEARRARWGAITRDIGTIIDHCLAHRPDIHVVLFDYDFLDATAAEKVLPKLSFHGATARQLNDAFLELGRKKMALAASRERCVYVQNWGALQHRFANDGPAPGQAPDYAPYPGGNPDGVMPRAAHVGDGIHPTDEAHRVMLDVAVEKYLKSMLTPGTVRN